MADITETEARIAAHLDRGDLHAAATMALERYGPQIVGFLASVLRDDDVAYEVFSQFAEDLWRGLPQFRRESPLRTWAYTLAWHAVQRWRNEAYRRRVRRFETAELSQLVDSIRISSAVRKKDLVDKLRDSLDDTERSILVLRVDRELSWREVALVMGVAESALRKRFERLREKLRAAAEQA